MKTNDISKLEAKAAKINRELKEAKAQNKNYYNAIVASAVKTAVKKGALPQKFFNEILDKYVTNESQRKFMQLPSLNKPEDITVNGSQFANANNQTDHTTAEQRTVEHQHQHN